MCSCAPTVSSSPGCRSLPGGLSVGVRRAPRVSKKVTMSLFVNKMKRIIIGNRDINADQDLQNGTSETSARPMLHATSEAADQLDNIEGLAQLPTPGCMEQGDFNLAGCGTTDSGRLLSRREQLSSVSVYQRSP